MKNKNIKRLITIIAIGLIASVIACLLTGICKKPTTDKYDFNYSVTYKLDGEIKTFEGVYSCEFESTYPNERYYFGEYSDYGLTLHTCAYTIAQKDGFDLCIVTEFNESYLMGDKNNFDYSDSIVDPYIVVYDSMEVSYDDPEILDMFDIEIISWEYPEPIKNSFVFAGFSELWPASMFAMFLVAVLVFIACLIFIKKDSSVVYKDMDKISILLNVLLAVGGVPIALLLGWIIQAFATGPDWIYTVYLLIPSIAVFSLAASVSLRRSGFSKSGFFIQFISPVMFLALVIFEYIL